MQKSKMAVWGQINLKHMLLCDSSDLIFLVQIMNFAFKSSM